MAHLGNVRASWKLRKCVGDSWPDMLECLRRGDEVLGEWASVEVGEEVNEWVGIANSSIAIDVYYKSMRI
jgi:hypothetical protein